MTLRVSDWQSGSDLDSIRNSCDASALVQGRDISNLISVLIFDKNVMSQGRVEETPKIFGSLTLNTSSEKLNSIDRLQNSISNSTLLSLYGDLDNQCRDKMNNDKDCQGGQLTTSTNNILIRNTGFCVFRMKKIRSCSTWTRDSDDYFLNMPISVNNETWFQVDKTSLNIHPLTVQLLLGLEWCYSDWWKSNCKLLKMMIVLVIVLIWSNLQLKAIDFIWWPNLQHLYTDHLWWHQISYFCECWQILVSYKFLIHFMLGPVVKWKRSSLKKWIFRPPFLFLHLSDKKTENLENL